MNRIKETNSDCLSSALQGLFVCFSFRDRVVRSTPTNQAQLKFLSRLEDSDDVSSTLSSFIDEGELGCEVLINLHDISMEIMF